MQMIYLFAMPNIIGVTNCLEMWMHPCSIKLSYLSSSGDMCASRMNSKHQCIDNHNTANYFICHLYLTAFKNLFQEMNYMYGNSLKNNLINI